jgi:5-methylthioadenosine/S-adenosylhomocysteine deaminase
MEIRPYYEQEATTLAHTRDLLRSTAGDCRRRVLLRGATVLSMDPRVGDLAAGDVLVEGGTIAAVAPDLGESAGDGQAVVVDLTGMILIPGLCDSHRHCWQNQFRRFVCDVEDLDTYMASTHGGIALHYRPEDIYVGNLVSMLGAIDSGVTCVLDFSHNARTPAHSDAAIRAYGEAGIRAVHASAPPNAGPWDEQWPEDLVRLRDDYGSSQDRLVTVRMGIDMRYRATPELVAFAREAGLGISIDGLMGPLPSAMIERLGRAGALGPDVGLIHCTDFSDSAWKVVADSGARVTLAPTSDQQLGLADALPPIQKALDHGIRPSLSVDVEVALSTDMFSQMRAILTTQRMNAAALRYRGDGPAPAMISTRDVLEYATVQGAADNGLGDIVGTVTPGKAADLVAIRAHDVNNLPFNNAVGTVVLGADARNVDTVFVAGEVRKWRGELVGHDLARVRRLARESRDHVAAQAGFPIDVLAAGTGFPDGSKGVARGDGEAAEPDWGPTPSRATT